MENYDQQESNGKKTLWIIGGIILVVMIIALVYGATQKSLKNATQNADDEQVQLTSDGTTSSTVKGSNTTVPLEDLIELPVAITKLEVVNLETFPQKVQAHVTYGLSGDCAVADAPNVSASGKVFTITMTSHAKKNAPCTKNIVSGDTVIDLPVEGLPAGTYTVKAAKISKTFKLSADNEIQFSGDK